MRKLLTSILCCLSSLTVGYVWAQQPEMRLSYNRPATFFEESLPLGNGRLGALVYGHADHDMVQLNDITLWTGSPVDRQEDAGASVWIPKIRQALFAEDYQLADSLQLHVQGHNSSHYQPLGTLLMDWTDTELPASGYRRWLSLDSAIANVSYRRGTVSFRREYLVSAPDSLVAIHLTASKKGQISLRLELQSLLPHSVRASQGQLTMTGHANGDADKTIHFCTILRIDHRGGELTASDSTLLLSGADEATLWVVNATSFNGFNRHPVMQGAPYLEQANNRAWHTRNTSWDNVSNRHLADYRHFFARTTLLLGPSHNGCNTMTTDSLLATYNSGNTAADNYLETLYFQYGRYLLISSSRTQGVPANLQGLWNPHLWAPWRGNYTININLEENYWPAFCCNLPEMAAPLDGFIAALAENGRHTSENYYGIHHGWSAGHNSDIWAMANPVGEKNEKPEWANWAMGGAWLVQTLWQRFLFTLDDDYLQHVAYPLMKGAAEFCLDWLIENPNNPDELITAPSTSPENEYVNDQDYHGMTCYGGTADLAIIRELFLNTIQAAGIVQEKDDAALIKKLQEALSRLHPYTVGREGDLNEWYYDWRDYDPHHRHQSHLIGLFPGQHISDPSLLAACEKTLRQKGDQTTGWSTGWRINLWARLHKAEDAYHILQKLLTYVSPDKYQGPDRRRPGGGTYPNLMDAHPPFQIDGNFGGTAGISEMLVQSSMDGEGNTTILLLPALPKAWSEGEVSGLLTRGGFNISMKWNNGNVTTFTISSEKGGRATIVFGNKTQTVTLKPHDSRNFH